MTYNVFSVTLNPTQSINQPMYVTRSSSGTLTRGRIAYRFSSALTLHNLRNHTRDLDQIFRSTPPSRPNNIRGGLKCPPVGTSVRTYVRPSVRLSVHKKFFFPISMKFGVYIEIDEWCTTVCRMTRSKVKVKVTSAWKPLKRSRPSVPHRTNFDLCTLPVSVARSSADIVLIGRIAYRREGVFNSSPLKMYYRSERGMEVHSAGEVYYLRLPCFIAFIMLRYLISWKLLHVRWSYEFLVNL